MPRAEKLTRNSIELAKTVGSRRTAGNSRPKAAKLADETARREMSAEERRELIAERAYFRAAARGFSPGSEWDDWLAAEAEVESITTFEK